MLKSMCFQTLRTGSSAQRSCLALHPNPARVVATSGAASAPVGTTRSPLVRTESNRSSQMRPLGSSSMLTSRNTLRHAPSRSSHLRVSPTVRASHGQSSHERNPPRASSELSQACKHPHEETCVTRKSNQRCLFDSKSRRRRWMGFRRRDLDA